MEAALHARHLLQGVGTLKQPPARRLVMPRDASEAPIVPQWVALDLEQHTVVQHGHAGVGVIVHRGVVPGGRGRGDGNGEARHHAKSVAASSRGSQRRPWNFPEKYPPSSSSLLDSTTCAALAASVLDTRTWSATDVSLSSSSSDTRRSGSNCDHPHDRSQPASNAKHTHQV